MREFGARVRGYPPSCFGRFAGLLALFRLGARLLVRRYRFDVRRCASRRAVARLGTRPEKYPATRRELGLVPDHTGCHAVNVRNLRVAEAERITGTCLLLLRRVGITRT